MIVKEKTTYRPKNERKLSAYFDYLSSKADHEKVGFCYTVLRNMICLGGTCREARSGFKVSLLTSVSLNVNWNGMNKTDTDGFRFTVRLMWN